MNRMKNYTFSLLLVFGLCGCVGIQPVANEPASEEYRKEAERLARASNLDELLAEVPQQAVSELQEEFPSTEEQDSLWEEVRLEMEQEQRLTPDLVHEAFAQQLWDQGFTSVELKRLRRFYARPLGRKLARAMPEIEQSLSNSSNTWKDSLKIYMRKALIEKGF